MKRIVIYTRVSTDEQADRGNSLTNQEIVLRAHCKVKGYEVLKHFQEDYSAKTFDRPEWKELLKYVLVNKRVVDTILIMRWDRFSRNQKEAIEQIDNLRKMGIEVESVEQPLDMSIPENKLLLNIYLTIPEIENTKNSIRTTECSRMARLDGCWTGTAPIGYNNFRANGKSTLIPNEKAVLVIEAFKEVAKNYTSADSIRKAMFSKGLKLHKQSFLNMLRNVVYTGRIVVKEWKKDPETIVQGLHEAIIDDALFQMVQNVLAGKRNTKQSSHKENESFPLRNHLLCPECNGTLTGAPSKGRSRSYNYYKCQNNCIPSIRAEEANEEFGRFLSNIKIDPEVSELYQSIFEDVFKRNEGDKKVKAAQLSKKLEEVENGLEKATEHFFIKGSIDEGAFNAAIKQLNKKKADLNYEISQLQEQEDNFIRYTRFAVPFLTNLDKYYQNSTLHVKKFIIGSIFPEKLYYSDKSYRTTKLNEVLALIGSVDNSLGDLKNKKATKNSGLSSKAPPSGLEPETL